MRVSLSILGLSVFDFEASTDDEDKPDSDSAPLGFAGSGPGVTEINDEAKMLDHIQGDRQR